MNREKVREDSYMDTISAREAAVAKDPKAHRMKPYTNVTGPPFNSAVLFALYYMLAVVLLSVELQFRTRIQLPKCTSWL
jgi:hypothetical protein